MSIASATLYVIGAAEAFVAGALLLIAGRLLRRETRHQVSHQRPEAQSDARWQRAYFHWTESPDAPGRLVPVWRYSVHWIGDGDKIRALNDLSREGRDVWQVVPGLVTKGYWAICREPVFVDRTTKEGVVNVGRTD